MPSSLPKIIASILLGMAFLLGGAEVVSAQATAVEQAGSLLDAVKCTDWVDCLQKLPTMIPLQISYSIYILAAGILALAGYAFDAVLTMSIDHTFILKPFIDTLWTTIRDFSNMAFIFILLYAGIITMLGQPGWAKTVRNVVIIALLINFSLFFTKVVIDAGNILAVGVYEALAPIKTEKSHTTPAVGGLQERDLSLELTRHFGPQAILKASGTVESPFLAIMLFIIGAVINVLAAWAFFRVALMFIGRIIGFWFLMITSPFAFISVAFPGGKTAVFDKWLDNLIGLSFVAPVFLFFLYMIMQVLSSGALTATLANPNPDSLAKFSFDVLFVPIIMVIFIYMALDKAVSFSKTMAGGFGELGTKIGGMVMGVAGGAALGGAAMAGRAGGGRLAQLAQNSGALKNLATSDNYFAKKIGRTGLNLADKGATGTWDVRGAGGFIGKNINKGIKATGVDVGNVPKSSTGGLDAAQKREKQEDLAFAQKLKVSEEERRKIAAQADPNYTAAKNRAGSEQDAMKAAEEADRTSASSVAYIQAQEQDIVAKDNLSQVTAVANGSREGLELTRLTNELTALIAAETKAKDDKTKAEDAYNKAMVSGTITQAITDAFTDSVSAEAIAINARVGGEADRDIAQADFNTAYKAKIDTAKTTADTATATLISTAAAYAGSAKKLAAEAAKAQLDASQRIITNAEKAADNVASQRRASYAQEVEKRGGTRNSQTAADIRGGVEPAAKKSEAEKLLEKLVKASENK